MSYDVNNVFARMLRGEIPCNKVYEDNFCLAFNDLYPVAPIHVLVIPRGPYRNFNEFCTKAQPQEVTGFFAGVTKVLDMLNLVDSRGYRLITNCGEYSGQTVDHFHLHILSGKDLGALIAK